MRVSAAVQRCSDNPTLLWNTVLLQIPRVSVCSRSALLLFSLFVRLPSVLCFCRTPGAHAQSLQWLLSLPSASYPWSCCSPLSKLLRNAIGAVSLAVRVSSTIFSLILWPAFLLRSLQSSPTLTDKLCHSSHRLTEATPLSSAHNYRAE